MGVQVSRQALQARDASAWTYVGCEALNQSTVSAITALDISYPAACTTYCAVQGYPYAGLNAQFCNCWLSEPSAIASFDDAECNFNCDPPYQTEYCGGVDPPTLWILYSYYVADDLPGGVSVPPVSSGRTTAPLPSLLPSSGGSSGGGGSPSGPSSATPSAPGDILPSEAGGSSNSNTATTPDTTGGVPLGEGSGVAETTVYTTSFTTITITTTRGQTLLTTVPLVGASTSGGTSIPAPAAASIISSRSHCSSGGGVVGASSVAPSLLPPGSALNPQQSVDTSISSPSLSLPTLPSGGAIISAGSSGLGSAGLGVPPQSTSATLAPNGTAALTSVGGSDVPVPTLPATDSVVLPPSITPTIATSSGTTATTPGPQSSEGSGGGSGSSGDSAGLSEQIKQLLLAIQALLERLLAMYGGDSSDDS